MKTTPFFLLAMASLTGLNACYVEPQADAVTHQRVVLPDDQGPGPSATPTSIRPIITPTTPTIPAQMAPPPTPTPAATPVTPIARPSGVTTPTTKSGEDTMSPP